MDLRYEFRKRARHTAVPALCACMIAYFGYSAVHGDHGLIAYLQFGQKIAALEADLDAIQARRQALEHRVSQLRPQSLDPDLLDERARETLGFAHPNERVILLETGKPPPGQDQSAAD